MAERTRVNLTVSPDQKEQWDDAVEHSSEYSSLSDLIRQAVTHELSDESAATALQGPPQGDVTVEIPPELTDTLERIENTLGDVDDRLANVEKETTATARTDLKNAVFDALPEDGNASAEQIADELGEDRERVSSVLRQLTEQTGAVTLAGEIEGQQFFAREADE